MVRAAMLTSRPQLLPRAVESFRRQTYPDKWLTILDTKGVWKNQKGDCWEIIHSDRQIDTIGEAFDSIIFPFESEVCFTFCDDDIIFPQFIEEYLKALGDCDYVGNVQALEYFGDHYRRVWTDGFYTSGFCKVAAFKKVGGYGKSKDADVQLFRKLKEIGARFAKYDGEPLFAFNQSQESARYSENGMIFTPVDTKIGEGELIPAFGREYFSLPIDPGVHAKPFGGVLE